MPFKPSEGAHFKADLRFPPPIGRIAKSLGTSDRREFEARVALLRSLHSSGQFAVLLAFKDGAVSMAELLHARRERRLTDDDLLTDLTLRRPLFDGITDAIDRSAAGDKTIARYQLSAKKLARSGLVAADAQLRDLVNVDWRGARRDWKGSPSDWNALRRMLSTVLTITLGGDTFHPFRRRIMKLIPRAAEPKGRAAPITLAIFLDIQARVPEYVRPCLWTLFLTGARAGEYDRMTEADLDHETHGVRVPGTKTAGSKDTVYVDPAFWSWIVMGVPSPLGYQRLFKHFKKAAKAAGHPSLRLHDLRGLHSIVPLEEGAPIQDVMASMRHATAAMTLHYAKQVGKGQVAGMIGNALKKAGGVVLPFPNTPTVTGTGYDAGVAKRESKRLDPHRARLQALMDATSTTGSTMTKLAENDGQERTG